MFHKLKRSSAIALAVISISATAVAEPMSTDTGAGSRQTRAKIIYVSGPTRPTRVPEVSAAAPTASLTSIAPGRSNRAPAELLMPGIPGTDKGGNRLQAGADHERVAYIPGDRNDDNIFNRASSRPAVDWVVAKKCGWICVVRRF